MIYFRIAIVGLLLIASNYAFAQRAGGCASLRDTEGSVGYQKCLMEESEKRIEDQVQAQKDRIQARLDYIEMENENQSDIADLEEDGIDTLTKIEQNDLKQEIAYLKKINASEEAIARLQQRLDHVSTIRKLKKKQFSGQEDLRDALLDYREAQYDLSLIEFELQLRQGHVEAPVHFSVSL